MARLVVSPEAQNGEARSVELGTEAVTIGREPTNSVALAGETKASRRHCQVVRAGDGWEVVDLESRNGTRVNGDPVKRRRLLNGDLIEVGETRIRYEDESSAARDAATKGACFLEHAAGDRKGERVPLTAARTTLGRRDSNTIVLTDKMASGHHAEIVKDLNGYTIRDLGSTNGTLVNGEPTTEAALTHGSRVRIGNARFVFKDPSMADVDVELAGLREEEDAGWGMMAEIDVGRTRGGAGGLLVGLGLLAALAGGAFWATTREGTGAGARSYDFSNLVADPGFDGTEAAWAADAAFPGGEVAVDVTSRGRPGGGPALSVGNRAATPAGGDAAAVGVARFAADLDVLGSSAYRLSAQMRRQGPGRGDLAVQWLGRARGGATAHTTPVASPSSQGSWERVEAVVWPPPWAGAVRILVLAGPGTTVFLDDVRFAADGSVDVSAKRMALPGDRIAAVGAGGGIDLVATGTVLFHDASPWARMPGGRLVGGPGAFRPTSPPTVSANGIEVAGTLVGPGAGSASAPEEPEEAEEAAGAAEGPPVPATIRWQSAPEGAAVTVEVPGAEATGLAADFPRDHLADGVSALGSFAPARLPLEPGGVDGARKVLAGQPTATGSEGNLRPPTLVSLETPDGADDAALRVLRPLDPGFVRVGLLRPGTSAAYRLVTEFQGERQRAQADLDEALRVLESSPGEGIARLRSVADSYPFHESVRRTALEQAAAREARAAKDVAELAKAVADFEVYRSDAALGAAVSRANRLAAQFPPKEGVPTSLETEVKALVDSLREKRALHEAETAAPEVRRLSRLAQMLESEEGYEAVAAVYYDEIVRRFGAIEARDADGETGRRVKEARERRDALLAKDAVRAAFPARPR
jgi:pSer/pThr/pTyr-binding forkhead associated (FHA) protein